MPQAKYMTLLTLLAYALTNILVLTNILSPVKPACQMSQLMYQSQQTLLALTIDNVITQLTFLKQLRQLMLFSISAKNEPL